MKNNTQEQKLIELLKYNYLSNYQMQSELRSSSADRIARNIRTNPPEGYVMTQRKKDCEVNCLEYKLVKTINNQLKLGV